MNKPRNEGDRISMAMGWCPDCQRPFAGKDRPAYTEPSNGCRTDGNTYECMKGKKNERYTSARRA